MKRALLLLCICCCYSAGKAQFLDKIKNKINQKVNDAVNNAGKNKKKSGSDSTSSAKTSDSTATAAAGIDKTGASDASSAGTGSSGSGPASTTKTGSPQPAEDIRSYSKFDFVPGEKIIVAEDFAQDNLGEFPDKWNTKTNAEIVTLSTRPGKWLEMKQEGVFFPEYIPELPDNFTLQVDLLTNNNVSNISSLIIALANTKTTSDKFNLTNNTQSISEPGLKINLNPLSSGDGEFSYSTDVLGSTSMHNPNEFHINTHPFATLSIWRQKTRLRVYLNSTKMLDLPRALNPGTIINSLVFGAYVPDFDKKGGAFYLSNIRVAVGAPDTRNKLITEGKFVTHGILFDVNSDQIKAPSYGALQDIANVLKASPEIKVRIVGHTDSDGDDAANLELSRKRAEAVKNMLVANFSIDAARMTTEGKGETQPIDSNTSSEGKANNRRVEFLKQ